MVVAPRVVASDQLAEVFHHHFPWLSMEEGHGSVKDRVDERGEDPYFEVEVGDPLDQVQSAQWWVGGPEAVHHYGDHDVLVALDDVHDASPVPPADHLVLLWLQPSAVDAAVVQAVAADPAVVAGLQHCCLQLQESQFASEVPF